MILVRFFGFEVPECVCRQDCRNFKSSALPRYCDLGSGCGTASSRQLVKLMDTGDEDVLRAEQEEPRPAARSVQGDLGAAPDRVDHLDERARGDQSRAVLV